MEGDDWLWPLNGTAERRSGKKKITCIQIKKKHLHEIFFFSLLCIAAIYRGTLLRLLLQGPDGNLHEELHYPD